MKFIGKVIFLIPLVTIFIVATLLFGTIPFIASGASLFVVELFAYVGLVGFYNFIVQIWTGKGKYENPSKHVWIVPAVLIIALPILNCVLNLVSCGK